MIFPSFQEIADKAKHAFKRFPITLTWCIVGSIFFMCLIEIDPNNLFDHYKGSLLTFSLGVSWFIGTKFLIEQLKQPEKWQWLKLVTLGLLIIFFIHLPDLSPYDVNPKFYVRFTIYLIAGHLFLFFAPFAFRWNKEAYWNYLKSVCIAVGRSILFSGVLYLGLVLALLAIKFLFDFDIQGKRYGQLFVFCLGIVNTWTYLSDFPKNVLEKNTIKYNKALEVFVKFILIPLVLLYIVILYAYTLKIILAWSLPKGWVSNLVTALALLGFSIQIMVNPIQKTIKSWTINRFYPWFYFLLLPLIILLFIAIFKRIGDYGITENRYFLLLLALWILGITLYLLFSKKRRLKILPISLFILAVLSSFGFWGAFSISKNSQVKQFENVLQKARDNNNMVSGKEYRQLESIINYLDDRKSVSELDAITGIAIEETFRDTTNSWNNYLSSDSILDSLGIEIDPSDNEIIEDGNHYYYSQWNKPQSYSIVGYNYFTAYNYNGYDEEKKEIGSYRIQFISNTNELWLLSKQDSTETFLISLNEKLVSLSKYGDNLNEVNPEELIIESSNEHLSTKLIFTELSFYIKKDSIRVNSANAYLFLKHN